MARRWCLVGVLFLSLPVCGNAQGPVGWWRFDGKSGAAIDRPVAGGVDAAPKGKAGQLTATDDVPAPFIYDPLTRKSVANSAALRTAGEAAWLEVGRDAFGKGGSFTLEAFASPDGDARRTMVVAGVVRSGKAGSEAGVGVRWLNNFNQSYWGAFAAEPDRPRREWSAGHYVTISRLTAESLGWRHVAFVYDAEKKTATVYLDRWLVATQKLDAALALDGPLCLGGGPNGGTFAGKIDEVRLTPAVLSPGQFLRAVDKPIEGVDFTAKDGHLPRGTGFIDLREAFGAVGDGVTDDTAAFEQAFAVLPNKVPGAFYTLYVPAGTYLVSRPLHFGRFFVLQGAGRDKTLLRLADRAKDFQDANKPAPVVRASSTGGPPGSNRAVNGSSIGLYVHDLAIDTGKGNPGAKAIEYHSNNHGAMERVDLRSGDGQGVVGLDLTHKTNGPALIKDVTVTGFRHGVTAKYAEYSLTFEHLTLKGQGEAGILNEGNLLAIRKLTSTNAVPAVVSKGTWGMVTLLDADLRGGAADQVAVVAEGALYARNVKVAGYGSTIRRPRDKGDEPAPVRGDVAEYVGDHVVTIRGVPKASLNLPVEETPEVPWGDVGKDWVSIAAFADKKQGNDWAPALEAALASGAKTVYFPQGGYEISQPVSLTGSVVRLFGMRSSLHRPKGAPKEQPVLVYDDPDAKKVVAIERMDLDGLEHRSPGTLVVKHGTPERYTTTAGCGKLFCENVAGTDWHFDHPQQVWVRQWNPEAHGEGPCVVSKGATLWSLGFKTEYESSKLWASAGAKTEILGGFVYPVNKGIPRDRPVFKNEDSAMSLIYGMSVYVAGHDLQVLDTRKGEAVETRMKDLLQLGARFRMDLYRSGE